MLLIIVISGETGLIGSDEADKILLPTSFSSTERVDILKPAS